MIKKILSLVLIAVFSLSVTSFAAPGQVVYEYDRASLDMADDMLELTGVNDALEIVDEQNITRADFVYAMGILLKWTSNGSYTVPFKDIASDDIRLPAIYSGLKLGYISESDTFYADTPIKLVDAIKLAASGAGYSSLASVKGGYPAGYITCARDAGILDGIDMNKEYLNGNDFKLLMYNMMICNYMYQNTFGDRISYENTPGRTLLGDIHSIYVFEGLVTATPQSRLTNSGYIQNGRIEINGTEYISKVNSYDLLGFNVMGFYNKTGSNYTVLSAVKAQNTVIEASGADFESYPPSSDKIAVWNENKTVTYRLASNYNFIYNGRSCPTHANAYWGNEFIDMTLVDNDDDGSIDVVFAYEYKYLTIGLLNDLKLEITDSLAITEKISLSDPDTIITVTNSLGDEIPWYTLKENTVVSALVSEDGKLIKLRELVQEVSGTVDLINTSDSTVTIAGEEYKVTSYCTASVGELKLGNSYTLRSDGKYLVAPGNLSDRESYGYLIEAASTTGLQSAVIVRMLKEDGSVAELNLAKKITLNDAKGTLAASSAVTAVTSTRQLVKYRLNSDGEISHIRTATPAGTSPFENKSDEYTKFRKFDTPTPLYKSGTRSFLPYGNISQTMFFVVPIDDAKINDEDMFDTVDYTKLGLYNNRNYNSATYGIVEMYDISSSGMCRVAVFQTENPVSQNMTDAGCGLIEKITTSINDEGEVTSKIYLVGEDGYTSYNVKPDFDISAYSAGDVIRYVVDGKNEIANMALDFDLTDSSNRYSVFNNWTTNADTAYILSRIYSYENGYVYLAPVSERTTVPSYDWTDLKFTRFQGTIVVFDINKSEARYGDASDFKEYKESGEASYVLAKTNKYLDGEFIVIYEE